MPRRLALLLLCALGLLSSSAQAQSQSTLTLRGNYWRDRNTRIFAPQAVLKKEYATGTTVEAEYLLDAITSASVSAGVQADEPFTELRSDVGLRATQRLGPARVNLNYRYSTESDYWSHSAGGGVTLELFDKNLTLAANYTYNHSLAARRADAKSYVLANGDNSVLQGHYGGLSVSQVLSRRALFEAGYELTILDGYQANPYRFVKVSGTTRRETVPLFRVRHTGVLGFRYTPVYRAGPLRNLTFMPRYRFYQDTWGIQSHTPELFIFLQLGPVEFRFDGRYYTQSQATFFRANAQGLAEYGMEVPFDHCPQASGSAGAGGTCATGDSKLSAFDALYVEGRVLLELSFLDRPWNPLGPWLGRGWVAVSMGRYWNTGFANQQYGDAWVGGLEIKTPL